MTMATSRKKRAPRKVPSELARRVSEATQESATATPDSVRGKVVAAGQRARSTANSANAGNGMQRFTMHVADKAGKRLQAAVQPRARAGFAAAPSAKELDPETAAYRYLKDALDSDRIPEFADPESDDAGSEFQRLGTETVPLTGTRTVKFRQTLHKVPVYGSLVTVELDQDNQCLAINSSMGAPKNVSAVAKVAPQDALETAAAASGMKAAEVGSTPRLNYYFDRTRQAWTLAYIIENVPNRAARDAGDRHQHPALFDHVVDAHSGKLIASLPRTPTAVSVEQGVDDLGITRTFTAERNSTALVMRNPALNVSTFGFKFADPIARSDLLPGTAVKRPSGKPWPPSAVSAHANAETLALFLRDVLLRNGIDNRGGPMVSTVDCVIDSESTGPGEWLNAYWDPDLKQMVYGQRTLASGQQRSMASMLDIVAHEMFHGVTDGTARLEYAAQSGALNESYSDIFGVIVQNLAEADRSRWQWRLGIGFQADGVALRDVKSPANGDQPAHMDDYVETGPPSQANDWGAVHTNSGIHNFAAYRIMSARSAGRPVFTTQELAALFYLALTQHLSRTSGFSDSRRAVVLVAQTLFRNDTPAVRARKKSAIERGYTAAGIH
jgi:Zn-dependent metalloprotease